MKLPKYISPSSLHIAEWDRERYAAKYLTKNRPPSEPQTIHMAIGSAFDAYVKAHLYHTCIGSDQDWTERALFDKQVEPHVRDAVRADSQELYEAYRASGAYDKLCFTLLSGIGEPRFESRLEDTIGGVPLLGKPDIFFLSTRGARVVYDFKVNGYYSASLTSPMRGYQWCWDSRDDTCVQHKDYAGLQFLGIEINRDLYLDDLNTKWADQLAIYGWLIGEKVGSEKTIYGIEQITGPKDRLRISCHRFRIRPEYQFKLLERLQTLWRELQDGTFIDPKIVEALEGSEYDDTIAGML